MRSDLILYTYVITSCFVLQTYCPNKGLSSHLYVNLDHLSSWLMSSGKDPFIEIDINNIIVIRRGPDNTLHIMINWIHEYSDELHGFRQDFYVSADRFLNLTVQESSYTSATLIHRYEGQKKSRIILATSANELYRKLTTKEKHAFIHCISKSFYWGNSTIEIHSDWGKDFWFREYLSNGSIGICGGICRSETTVMGHDAIRYEVHT